MLIIFHFRIRNGLLQNQLFLLSACEIGKLTPLADVSPHNFANLMLRSLLFLTLRAHHSTHKWSFPFFMYEFASNTCTYSLCNKEVKENISFAFAFQSISVLSSSPGFQQKATEVVYEIRPYQ